VLIKLAVLVLHKSICGELVLFDFECLKFIQLLWKMEQSAISTDNLINKKA